MRWAESIGARVSRWGPYEIEKGLYDRALRQKARLESGAILFKCIDENFRPATASNCIHAVSDVDMDQGALHVGPNWGDNASRIVAGHLKRWMINPEKTHPWVIARLGVADYPMAPRTLE
ncbi:MAG: hypothetical protein E6K70_18720 [Planctomycetota bacterium]|nr:MAG: hypothetical protein E6K70_18720 [Planctomycetota bacterium]